MKYTINARQQKNYLQKADEIFVEGRDYRIISDLFIDYPDKMIILDVPADKESEEQFQNTIIEYAKCSENFCCRLHKLDQMRAYHQNNIKFFYRYPATTWYEVRGLIDLGAEYVTIAAPLTFQIHILKNIDMKFRMVPNVCYDNYIPRQNGLHGQWVRPEDVSHYEDAIYIFDFEDADLAKERALFRIYAEDRLWNGNLNLLLTNFNINVDNRAILEDLGEMRSTCGQKCMSNKSCHYCDQTIIFEHLIRKKEKENKTNVNLND